MNKLTRYGLIMGAGIALLGLGGITAAFASEAVTDTGFVLAQVEEAELQTAQVETEGDEDAPARPRGRRGMGFLDRDEMKQVVADVLGITVEELEAAHEEGVTLEELAAENGVSLDEVEAAIFDAKVAAIDEAVAAGEITQDQADMIVARMELAQIARDIFDRDEMKAIVAEVIGVTVEELEAAREDGTARELFENADHEAIKAALDAYRAEQIQEALDAGLITEEQAEQLSEFDGRRGRGHRGGRGHGPGGPRGGNPPADAPAQDA